MREYVYYSNKNQQKRNSTDKDKQTSNEVQKHGSRVADGQGTEQRELTAVQNRYDALSDNGLCGPQV